VERHKPVIGFYSRDSVRLASLLNFLRHNKNDMNATDQHTEFTQQITQFMSPLRQLALQFTKDQEDANDLVQDTLLRAYRYWHKFRPDSNLKAWLFTIMRNTFITCCQQKKRERRVIVSANSCDLANSPLNSIANGAISEDLQEDIWTAVTQLMAMHQEAFLLHLAGYKYFEIARKLAIPVGTVKSRIFIARKELQRRIIR
jgi:RNA polymerase sigma factor (sigma-70 family)